jgi:nucleoside-diphosphate-sugar epimerase
VNFILVTGANGFVGTHLCRHLLAKGYRVRAAVRRPGTVVEPGVTEIVAVGELGSTTDWAEALEGVDGVVHLAAHAHQVGVDGPEHEATCRRVNAEGTHRLAEAVAAADSVQRFVFVSSVGTICSAADAPIDETTPCRPDSAYGRSKLEAERAVEAVLAASATGWCIIRPPLVYGAGNPGNMERLLRLVRTGAPLPFGGIQNRRSFIYVGNLVDVIELGLRSPAAHRRTYVVADSEVLSTPALVRRLGHVARIPVRMLSIPIGVLSALARVGDVAARALGRSVGFDSYSLDRLTGSLAVDAGRVRSELGWEPPFEVDEGLHHTMLAVAE